MEFFQNEQVVFTYNDPTVENKSPGRDITIDLLLEIPTYVWRQSKD